VECFRASAATSLADFVQLYAVAGGIADEGLSARSHGGGVRRRDSLSAQVCNRRVEIVHLQREVLPQGGGRVAFDEVDLLTARVQPCAGEPEVWTIGAPYESETVDVELKRLVHIADVDGHVMDGCRLHGSLYS